MVTPERETVTVDTDTSLSSVAAATHEFRIQPTPSCRKSRENLLGLAARPPAQLAHHPSPIICHGRDAGEPETTRDRPCTGLRVSGGRWLTEQGGAPIAAIACAGRSEERRGGREWRTRR